MNSFNEILERLDGMRHYAYSLIRIFLGLALFIRGWLLISDPSAIIEIVRAEQLHMWFSYIAIAHLIGGFLMCLGLLTRLGAILQLPVLFSAVFIVHSKNGLLMGGESLELAALVLFLLLIYFVFGAGELTLPEFFKKFATPNKNPEVRSAD